MFFFRKENLPNLHSLSCKYREGLLLELYRYDFFDQLTLHVVNDDIFEQISLVKNLYGLQFIKGNITNLDSISLVRNLHWISLNVLTKLENLNGLTEIENLEHLEIGYCTNIKNWDFLLGLKN